MHRLFLLFFKLSAQCLNGLVGGFFKGSALPLGKEVVSGNGKFYLGNLILMRAAFIQTEIYLPIDNGITVCIQLFYSAFYKIEQFGVCIEMD